MVKRQPLERIKDLLIDSVIRTGLTILILAISGGVGLYFFPSPYILMVIEITALIYTLLLLIATIHAFERERLEFRLHGIELTLDHIYNSGGVAHLDELARSIDELTLRISTQ